MEEVVCDAASIAAFHRGLSLYIDRTEEQLKDKQTKFKAKLKAEENLLNGLHKKLKTLTNLVEERLSQCWQTDTSLNSLFNIRSTVSLLLDRLGITISKKSSDWDPRSMLQALRLVEEIVKLEDLPIPLFNAPGTSHTKDVLQNVHRTLADVEKKLSIEYGASQVQHNKLKARDECYSQWKDLLDHLVSQGDGFFQCKRENTLCKEIQEIIEPMVTKVQSKFSRPIPVARFASVDPEDPFEEEEGLLDKVITTRDPGISYLYQLTHRYFTTPEQLFTMISTRFCLIPIEPEHPALVRTHKELVLEFLLSWIHNFYVSDIYGTLHNDIKLFIKEVVEPSGMQKTVTVLEKTLKQKHDEVLAPKESKFWKQIHNTAHTLKKPFNFLNMRPKHFAEQLALYEHHLYANISSEEFIGQNWGSKGDHKKAENIIKFSDHLNDATTWYANQILDLPTPQMRAHLIGIFIYIMLLSFQLNNFLGTFEILFALNSLEIFRLSQSWAIVPEEKRKIVWLFTQFIGNMFNNYRNEYDNIKPPAIPYLGIFLSDLTFLEDGNPTSSKDGSGRINFYFKCSRVYQTIHKALEHQHESYKFPADEKLLAYLHREFTLPKKRSTEEMYQLSLQHETKGPPPFSFPAITSEELSAEIESLRSLEILRIFGVTVPQRIPTGPITGANDYIHTKTDQLRSLLPATLRANLPEPPPARFRKSSSLTVSFLSPEADEKEIITHMKIPGRGITPEVEQRENGEYITFFYSEAMMDWLATNLGSGTRFKAIDIIQSLLDHKLVVGLTENDAAEIWKENPKTKLVFANEAHSLMSQHRRSTLITEIVVKRKVTINYEELAEKMKHPQSGIKLKTHKVLLKKFPNTFVGEEAVTWLSYHLDLNDRETVVGIGQRLLDLGLIRHVSGDHTFADKNIFYNFT